MTSCLPEAPAGLGHVCVLLPRCPAKPKPSYLSHLHCKLVLGEGHSGSFFLQGHRMDLWLVMMGEKTKAE